MHCGSIDFRTIETLYEWQPHFPYITTSPILASHGDDDVALFLVFGTKWDDIRFFGNAGMRFLVSMANLN